MGPRRTLAGRYELLGVLGRGGMGAVYRGRDRVLGREVAIKLLPADVADQDPVNVARFENEGRAAAALNHRGVVGVFDVGIDDGVRFIVMELVGGRSLDAVLRDDGPLEPGRARAIAIQVADALAAASAAGIVHRDIKPANVMLGDGDAVKVLDFGIASAVDGRTLTGEAMLLGTAAYMAPERIAGARGDARSDIYSLGCLTYALIAGQPPFGGSTAVALLREQASATPTDLRLVAPDTPAALSAAVMRMLAKSPADRPQTAAQARNELRRPTSASSGATAVPGTRPRPPRATGPQRSASAPAPAVRAPTARTAVLPRRRRAAGRVTALAALAASIVAIVAVLAGLGSNPGPNTAAGHTSPAAGHDPGATGPVAGPNGTATRELVGTTKMTAPHHHASTKKRSRGSAKRTTTSTGTSTAAAATATTTTTTTTGSDTIPTPSTGPATPTTTSPTTTSPATTTSPGPPTTTTPPATSTTPPPATATPPAPSSSLTVGQAAASLTTLVNGDVSSGTVDAGAGAQIDERSASVLSADEAGRAFEASFEESLLAGEVAVLVRTGGISATAAPAIDAAVSNLQTALGGPGTQSRGGDSQGGPGGGQFTPPGHGGVPPGQARQANDRGSQAS